MELFLLTSPARLDWISKSLVFHCIVPDLCFMKVQLFNIMYTRRVVAYTETSAEKETPIGSQYKLDHGRFQDSAVYMGASTVLRGNKEKFLDMVLRKVFIEIG